MRMSSLQNNGGFWMVLKKLYLATLWRLKERCERVRWENLLLCLRFHYDLNSGMECFIFINLSVFCHARPGFLPHLLKYIPLAWSITIIYLWHNLAREVLDLLPEESPYIQRATGTNKHVLTGSGKVHIIIGFKWCLIKGRWNIKLNKGQLSYESPFLRYWMPVPWDMAWTYFLGWLLEAWHRVVPWQMVNEGHKRLREVSIIDWETNQTLGNDQIAFHVLK